MAIQRQDLVYPVSPISRQETMPLLTPTKFPPRAEFSSPVPHSLTPPEQENNSPINFQQDIPWSPINMDLSLPGSSQPDVAGTKKPKTVYKPTFIE